MVVTVPGRSPDERSSSWPTGTTTAPEPGANDNASGIAALIELARSYGSPVGARPVSPLHTLVFVATDGERSEASAPNDSPNGTAGGVVAAIDLTALAGRGPPRLVLAGTEPRLASPRAGRDRVATGHSSRRVEGQRTPAPSAS